LSSEANQIWIREITIFFPAPTANFIAVIIIMLPCSCLPVRIMMIAAVKVDFSTVIVSSP
jgi:hypothetical protein